MTQIKVYKNGTHYANYPSISSMHLSVLPSEVRSAIIAFANGNNTNKQMTHDEISWEWSVTE